MNPLSPSRTPVSNGPAPDRRPAASAPQPEPTMARRVSIATRRTLWWTAAWCALTLGLIGVMVPGLPTTPLVLLAAFAAARGSPRLDAWLRAHAQFGPLIDNWGRHGAVSRRAKWIASVTMALCGVILWWLAPNAWMRWLPIAIMTLVAVWLWRRPEGPAAGQD